MADFYASQYETRQGETWDSISSDFYDSPFYVSDLIAANPQHANVVIFTAGFKLEIPIIEAAAPDSLPPWKRG